MKTYQIKLECMDTILQRHNIDIIKKNDNLYVECRLLGSLLGLSNILVSINSFSSDEKTLLNRRDSSCRMQKTSCLTEKGFKKLLCCSRKPMAVLIATELGLDINHKYVAPETSFLMEKLDKML